MADVTDLVQKGLKTKTVIMTDYSTIDSIIETYFDLEPGLFEMICRDEVGSSQYAACWDVDVEPEYNPEDQWDMNKIEAVKNKKPTGGTQVILNYLCFLGIVPAGRYIIDVSW